MNTHGKSQTMPPTPEADEELDLRGVAALHNFWYDEAEDAFRQAEAIDPGFALAYWGEAMTHNHPIWMEIDRPAGKLFASFYALFSGVVLIASAQGPDNQLAAYGPP